MYKGQHALILGGGVDINPNIYGAPVHPFTQTPNNRRDAVEIEAIQEAQNEGKPIIGICRGAQLICAIAGGTLWQHSEGHVGDGCYLHEILTDKGNIIEGVTSCHHQIMCVAQMKPEDYKVLAVCPFETPVYSGEEPHKPVLLRETLEVVYFPKLNALAIQAHPEWMDPKEPFRQWLDDKILELFNLRVTF